MGNTSVNSQGNVEIPAPLRVEPAQEPVNPLAKQGDDELDDEAVVDSDAATRGTAGNKDDDIGNDPVEQVSPQAGKDVEGW